MNYKNQSTKSLTTLTLMKSIWTILKSFRRTKSFKQRCMALLHLMLAKQLVSNSSFLKRRSIEEKLASKRWCNRLLSGARLIKWHTYSAPSWSLLSLPSLVVIRTITCTLLWQYCFPLWSFQGTFTTISMVGTSSYATSATSWTVSLFTCSCGGQSRKHSSLRASYSRMDHFL